MANEEESAVEFVSTVLDECLAWGFKSIRFFAVLDRASRDNTRALLEDLKNERAHMQVVWSPDNRNVVDAYVCGYQEALRARCDWILEIDAGFSHRPSDISQFFERMLDGYDCVFGSRFCKGATGSDGSLKRWFISRGGTILTNLLLGTRLKDMTSGFEIFTREALEEVLRNGIYSKSPFFQTEIKVHCRNRRIIEVPIQYRGASHNIDGRTVMDSFRNLWRLFGLRLRRQL